MMWDLALRDKSLVDSRSNALLSSSRADLSAWQSIRKSIAALESTFSKGDSVLGEQCGSVAKITKETSLTASGVPCFVKGTNAKFANLPQFSQSSHSPTAKRSFFRKQATAVQGGGTKAGFFRTPRILEEENQAECEKSAANKKVDSSKQAHFLSLRDFALAKSWQSTPPKTQTLESTFSPQANSLSLSSRADKTTTLSSRDFRKEVVAIHNQKADSRNFFTSAKQMDCHAIATALARNDSNNSPCEKVDSRSFHNSTKIERLADSQTPQAAGFLMKKPSKRRILGFDNNTKIERLAGGRICR
ncbi:hypothetical protein [Helicobacter canis]|nr:hypothetical protein [Helicobacter canis]